MTNKPQTTKRAVCIIVWIVSLPIRILITALLGPISLICAPFWLLIEAHQWACMDKTFGDSFWAIPKSVWWNFLILGECDL